MHKFPHISQKFSYKIDVSGQHIQICKCLLKYRNVQFFLIKGTILIKDKHQITIHISTEEAIKENTVKYINPHKFRVLLYSNIFVQDEEHHEAITIYY